MLVKTCSICNKELPVEHFYKWKYSKDGLRSQCKDCIKLANSKYYQTHKEQVLNNVKEYTELNKEKVQQYHHEYAALNSEKIKRQRKEHDMTKREIFDTYKTCCIKCGERRSYVIDFHHIDPSIKEFTLGNRYRGSNEKIIEEIKKCVCLCSNCHREFHYLYGITPDRPIENLEEYLNMSLLDIKQFTTNHINNTKLIKGETI